MAVVAIIGVVFTGSTAEASCFRPPDVEADLVSSDLVFVGLVTELANENRWAVVRLEEVWKGDPGSDRVEVRPGPGGRPGARAATSNDRTYVAGERYLVFASDLTHGPGAWVDFGEGRGGSTVRARQLGPTSRAWAGFVPGRCPPSRVARWRRRSSWSGRDPRRRSHGGGRSPWTKPAGLSSAHLRLAWAGSA